MSNYDTHEEFYIDLFKEIEETNKLSIKKLNELLKGISMFDGGKYPLSRNGDNSIYSKRCLYIDFIIWNTCLERDIPDCLIRKFRHCISNLPSNTRSTKFTDKINQLRNDLLN